MTKAEVKAWVVKNSVITQPKKTFWSASVTIGGSDINGIGSTIEKAYQDLTSEIYFSGYYSGWLTGKLKK